jgi:AcrR family transcriptional regulator
MQKRKKQIAEHALALFVEKGIENTSIQDIINCAGISKGTFYNYFSSKTECIEVILELARYDATLLRAELMIGKNPKDVMVLAEQVGILSQINRKRGLDILFQQLLHSGKKELKNLVLRQRLAELEWFSTRLIEIYGEEIRRYAFEASIIYYGMHQHLSFMSKLINQKSAQSFNISKQTVHYLTKIIDSLINRNTSILDYDKLKAFLDLHTTKMPMNKEIIYVQLDKIINMNLQNSQQQVVEAVLDELNNTKKRSVVMNALLKALIDEFVDTELESDIKKLSAYIWHMYSQD